MPSPQAKMKLRIHSHWARPIDVPVQQPAASSTPLTACSQQRLPTTGKAALSGHPKHTEDLHVAGARGRRGDGGEGRGGGSQRHRQVHLPPVPVPARQARGVRVRVRGDSGVRFRVGIGDIVDLWLGSGLGLQVSLCRPRCNVRSVHMKSRHCSCLLCVGAAVPVAAVGIVLLPSSSPRKRSSGSAPHHRSCIGEASGCIQHALPSRPHSESTVHDGALDYVYSAVRPYGSLVGRREDPSCSKSRRCTWPA